MAARMQHPRVPQFAMPASKHATASAFKPTSRATITVEEFDTRQFSDINWWARGDCTTNFSMGGPFDRNQGNTDNGMTPRSNLEHLDGLNSQLDHLRLFA